MKIIFWRSNDIQVKIVQNMNEHKSWGVIINFKSGKANCKNQEDNLVDKAKYTGMWTQR